MKTKFIILLLGIALLGSNSCKKGEAGPTGPEGKQGIQGIQGVTGVKGADGASIFSGTAVPTAEVGKNGDYYFRTSTGVLYGPKVAAGWGAGVNLKGANGTNGTNGTNGKNGSQFLSGTTMPAANLGAVGDFYFNSAQMILYGPKMATGWGIGTNLKAEARVMYSGWRSLVRMVDSSFDNTRIRAAHIYEPQLTTEVLKNAAILVYLDYGQGLYPLPFTSNAIGRMSTINFHAKPRELVIMRFVYDGGPVVSISPYIFFRYVIIPGNYYLAFKERKINLKDPAAVERAIKEMEH